jgi:hypothetical protein
MVSTETNPNYFATSTSADITIGQIIDGTDYPHTGLLKCLSQMGRGNYAVKGSATDFDIEQASTGNVVTVLNGSIYRDGEFITTTGTHTFTSSAFFLTSNSYHLLVVDSANAIAIRAPSAVDRVADLTAGDTIIAVLTYDSGGFGALKVQYLTTDKTTNVVSLGYDVGGAYTEGGSITGSASGVSFDSNVGINTTSPTSMLHLEGALGGEPTITIENTGTALTEPELLFLRSGAGAQSQDIGHIKWKAKDSGGNSHIYASIYADAQDETAGTEDGRILFLVTRGGTDSTEVVRISGSEGVVVNDGSKDMNFRIETDNETHALFVDGGLDAVGMGQSSPQAPLHVSGAGTTGATVIADGAIKQGASVKGYTEQMGTAGLIIYTIDRLDDHFIKVGSSPSIPPAPPNNVTLTIPTVTSAAEDVGRNYTIICVSNAGAVDDVVLDADAGITVKNHLDATLFSGGSPMSLVAGTTYKLICSSSTTWNLIALN